MATEYTHDFEKPIAELEQEIANLEKLGSKSKKLNLTEEIEKLRARSQSLKREIYGNLTPWQRVQLARDPRRPLFTDYLAALVEDFVELHGDRTFGDDKAVVTGLGRIGEHRVMIVGQKRGKTTAERIQCNFGSPHPEGYRKALLKMRLAEHCHVPVVCIINTAGAYPGIGAEERGQATAIATNLFEMARLRTPIICIVIGEGGSGGALGIGLGDRLAILENAYFSVISPEGCAAILWKDGGKAPQAAQVLKLAPKDLLELGVVDEIIPEPPGAAHHEPEAATKIVKEWLLKTLPELKALAPAELLAKRYERHRRIGKFLEGEEAKLYFESSLARASERARAKAQKEAGAAAAPAPPAAPAATAAPAAPAAAAPAPAPAAPPAGPVAVPAPAPNPAPEPPASTPVAAPPSATPATAAAADLPSEGAGAVGSSNDSHRRH